MQSFLIRFVLVAIIFSSCTYRVKERNEKQVRSHSKIRNGIVVNSKNVVVEQAFLMFEDGGLVPEDNIIKINQKVWLKLVVSGWKVRDSLVFLSGKEIVENSDKDILLDDKELFKDYEKGFTATEARYISLSMVITAVNELVDFFKISFKIRDELDPRNTIEGYYKLYLY